MSETIEIVAQRLRDYGNSLDENEGVAEELTSREDAEELLKKLKELNMPIVNEVLASR